MLNKTDKVVGGDAGEGPSPVELLLLLENLAECSLRLFTPQQPIRWKRKGSKGVTESNRLENEKENEKENMEAKCE